MNTFFKRLFGRNDNNVSEPGPTTDPPSTAMNPERAQRAAESILENEALTADLDDDAAKVLLDWGVALAQQIAADTAGMDNVAAEEVMYQPMRALRKMLRAISQWATAPDETGLQKIIEHAGVTYRSDYVAPDPDQQAQLLDQTHLWFDDPPELIRRLRQFIENPTIP